jgi:type IV pilus assembly protein PilM
MAAPKGVWGIDIGQCALKALRLELVDGRPTATAFDYVEHAKILTQPDADPDALIREALEKFLSRNSVRLDHVVIGIAGQSGLARFVKLPPVEERKIAEIVKFEAKQQIPFPLEEVVWDFQKVSGGEAVDGFALETEIGLFAMKRDVISKYLGYFDAAKVEVHTVQMAPLALVNFATYETLKKGGTVPVEGADAADPAADDAPKGKKRCAVVMDIGTDASNLIITDGGKIIWQRPIPLGGNHFTRALTKELKLTFAKAEHLKRNAAKSPEMANILRAIKPVLTDFVGEVQRSLGYFTNTHRDAHVAYLVGLGSAFKLPGLQKYLADKLSLEVKKPARFDRLGGDGVPADPLFQENLLTFPVAYGLALQGLGEARLTTNLLPHEIRTDRLIRAKKPYAVAAAAMLLIGVVGVSLGFAQDRRSKVDERIEKAEKAAAAAVAAHGSQETKFGAKKGEVDDTQGKVKTILAGQEERLNWARFFEVQTSVMPRPGDPKDGGNLTATFPGPDGKEISQTKLWRGAGDAGVQALAWFERRMRTGVPYAEALEDAASAHPRNLAMVNVEAVHTRWVSDPKAFLDAADAAAWGDPPKYGGKAIGIYLKDDEREKVEGKDRPVPVWKGPPGEGAWVVEIRGFTDHQAGPIFLRDGLIRNLQKFDQYAGQGEITVRNEKGELVKVKGEDKVKQFIVGVPDPVKGRVSHAFVFNFWSYDDTTTNTFRFINQSSLDRLLSPAGAAPGTGGPGRPPAGPVSEDGFPTSGAAGAPVAALGPDWRGLGTSGGTGPAAGPNVPGQGNTPFTPQTPATPTAPVLGPDGKEIKKEGATERRRYEFVVMLLWREPTPSTVPGSLAPAGGDPNNPAAPPAVPPPAAPPRAG